MTAVGSWRNEYSSVLEIRTQTPSGEFQGTYRSHTGASGTYRVSGWAPQSTREQGNRPFCLCVSWKPIDGAEVDPSWNWLSVMPGVLFLDVPGGAHQIRVLHGLVAATTLEAVMIRRPGVYAETLTFQKLALPSQAPSVSDKNMGEAATTRQLVLTNQNKSAAYRKIVLWTSSDGVARAKIEKEDEVIDARGFSDPAHHGNLQALALGGLMGSASIRAISIGGFINTNDKNAVLQLWEAESVSYQNKYTAVKIGQETFSVSFRRN